MLCGWKMEVRVSGLSCRPYNVSGGRKIIFGASPFVGGKVFLKVLPQPTLGPVLPPKSVRGRRSDILWLRQPILPSHSMSSRYGR